MVSSFRSAEKATGYQKFLRLSLYGWIGPDTLRLLLGCAGAVFTAARGGVGVLGVWSNKSDPIVFLSCSSLSVTSVSM